MTAEATPSRCGTALARGMTDDDEIVPGVSHRLERDVPVARASDGCVLAGKIDRDHFVPGAADERSDSLPAPRAMPRTGDQ